MAQFYLKYLHELTKDFVYDVAKIDSHRYSIICRRLKEQLYLYLESLGHMQSSNSNGLTGLYTVTAFRVAKDESHIQIQIDKDFTFNYDITTSILQLQEDYTT